MRTRSSGDGTVYKRSDGKYKAILRWTDVAGREVSKTRVCATLRAANSALAEFKRLRDNGQDPKAASKSVSDLLDSWLAFKASQVSAGTLVQYEYAAKHLKEGLGKVSPAKLQPEMIDKFLKSKGESGLSPRYVKLLRTVLSMAIEQGMRWRLVDTNVAKASASIKQTQSAGRALSEEQAKALLRAAKTDRLGALWTILLALGLRRGEALALEWADYDRRGKTLTVSKARKKEGSKVVTGSLKTESSRRVIPLPDFVCETLDAHSDRQRTEQERLLAVGVRWAEPTAMFTTVWGHWLDPDNASKLFKTVARRAGLDGWHMHELRHSAATFLLVKGVPIEQVSKLLGHSSIRITSDTYSHLVTEHLRGATDTMGGYLESLR